MYYSPFPAVADAVQSELEQYKQSEEEVKRLKDAMVSVQCVYTHAYHTCEILMVLKFCVIETDMLFHIIQEVKFSRIQFHIVYCLSCASKFVTQLFGTNMYLSFPGPLLKEKFYSV